MKIIVVILILFGQVAYALPKFSAKEGKPCSSCHLKSAGGGLRTEEGMKYGQSMLPVKDWQSELVLPHLTNKISDFVSAGADIETMYKRSRSDDETPIITEGAQLYKANLYVGINFAKNVFGYGSLVVDQKNEFFGLINIPSINCSFIAGKFVPNYGLKLEDEHAFVRSRLDLSWEDGNPASPGVQISFSPGSWNISGGVFNGPLKGTGTEFVGKIENIFSLSENFHTLLGANVMYRDSYKSTTYGGYAVFGIKDFSLTGEADVISTSGVNGVVAYAEGSYRLTSGLDAYVSYDYFDQDLELTTGTLSRYNLGVEFFPMQGVELKPY
jgi:hypothetical protein